MKTIELTRGYKAIVDDLDYDLATKHKWYSRVKKQKSGDLVYANTNSSRKTGRRVKILLHNVIAERMGIVVPEGFMVDHIDGNSLNNTRSNLRLASSVQNQANRHGLGKRSKGPVSKFKGVFWNKRAGKWEAAIGKSVDGHKKRHYIGVYFTEEEAAKAYDKKAIEFFGEFAALNFKKLD